MKHLPTAAGIILGLAFVLSGIVVLFNLAPMPTLPEGSPSAHFFAAFAPTGYLKFVKGLEILGGLLVAIPRTRNLGLLTLGPILVNILAFHLFITGGVGLFNPVLLLLCALALYLLAVERRAFAALIHRPPPHPAPLS